MGFTGSGTMAHNTDEIADTIVKGQLAFYLVAIQKKSLRAAASEMGCSHTTVKAYLTAYKKALADERLAENVEERRAELDAELNDFIQQARYIAEKYKDSKPLTAVGAINSALTAIGHRRAINGADMPKEVQQKNSGTISVVWSESEEG